MEWSDGDRVRPIVRWRLRGRPREEGNRHLIALGEKGFRSTILSEMATCLFELGRFDDADEAARECEEITYVDDVTSQSQWRAVRAKLAAVSGRREDALRLSEEAVAQYVDVGSDSYVMIARALLARAEACRLVGANEDAAAAASDALRLFDAKGNKPWTRRAAAALELVRA